MKKRILAMILLIALMLSASASAQSFVKLGETPIYENYYGDAKKLDPHDNEIYGNSEIISSDEWYKTTAYERIGNPLFPYNASVWNGESSPYNDGIMHTLRSVYDENWGEDAYYEAYKDINGTSILKEVPAAGGMSPGYEYIHSYNFGYFTESLYESSALFSDEYKFEDTHKFAYSTITNAVNGKAYKIDNIVISAIDNNGYIYYSTKLPKSGKEEEVFYKAKLKKYAVISVYLDGSKIAFDQIPYAENGRTLVPLRAIFEKLGATVSWDGATQSITATKDDTTVTLTLNNTTATKNGEPVTLDVPAKAIDGRTLVPVRFVSDCFGVDVDWNADEQKVILTSK